MHPEIRQESFGLCPECGMNLVLNQKTKISASTGGRSSSGGKGGSQPKADQSLTGAKNSGGKNQNSGIHDHKNHEDTNQVSSPKNHGGNIFKRKFFVSLLLTLPVFVIAGPVVTSFSLLWPGKNFLVLVLSSIVFFYGGWVFLKSSIRELRAKTPGMMTLVALAISVAYVYSLSALFFETAESLFWELTSLVTIMLLGHWLEARAVQGAQSGLRELAKLMPDTAEIILNYGPRTKQQGLKTQTIELTGLKTGDYVFIRPGAKIPADGLVVDGASEIDESIITGESKPVEKKVSSSVIAGSLNGDGSLVVKITGVGEQTFLAGIQRLIVAAQTSKSKLQLLSDRAAYWLTLTAVAVGLATFFVWIFSSSGPAFALERLVAVLVIACPHALGLAIPLVASISTALASRSGILVKDRQALEAARNIGIVLFDKTGTLTRGTYAVSKIITASGVDEDELLRTAASVENHSEHFAAQAIVKTASTRKLKLLPAEKFERLGGQGAKAMVKNLTVWVGGEKILETTGAKINQTMRHELTELATGSQTLIYIVVRRQVLGVIILEDEIRPESQQAIKELRKLKVQSVMVTGDSEGAARWVASKLGIDKYFAQVAPEQKAAIVKKLQEESRQNSVAFVGDGINDAPALAQADVGVAIGAGTNVAIESAGIILIKNDPRDIIKIIKLSRATYSKMRQNVFWATGYNIIAMPLAAGILASKGFLLPPAFSAILMSLSTIIVAANAMLLKKAELS